jgi:glycopeptide antibiotics resistance protein
MAVKTMESGPVDILFNILLFMPFGFFARGSGPARHKGLWIALAGFALSFAIETLQAGLPGRFPSLADLATNTLGAWLGQALANRLPRPIVHPPDVSE